MVNMEPIENQVLTHDVASDNERTGYRLVELVNEQKTPTKRKSLTTFALRRFIDPLGLYFKNSSRRPGICTKPCCSAICLSGRNQGPTVQQQHQQQPQPTRVADAAQLYGVSDSPFPFKWVCGPQ